MYYDNKAPYVPVANSFKFCNPCKQDKPPEGGVQMTPSKWVCYSCWKKIKR